VREYVYGIVEESAAAPSAPGIAGADLRVITEHGVGALVSTLPDRSVEMGRDEILTHSRVLAEALSIGTVLPMQFGIILDGPEAVRAQVLNQHAAQLRSQLERFDGKVELTVRGIYDEEALMREVVREYPQIARLRASLRGKPTDATYFARIQLGELVSEAVARKRELDAALIIEALAPTVDAIELAEPPHERAVLSGSFLVARPRVREFDDVLERIAIQQADRIRFKLTGPLPPHSFVELAEER
jgi:hypothetical protein